MVQNRRVQYSKLMIREALIELLQNERLDKISVTDLCVKANINRSTFYFHYQNVYDALDNIQREVFNEFIKYLKVDSNTMPQFNQKDYIKLTSILTYAKDNKDLFLMLLNCNDDTHFLEKVITLLEDIFYQYRITKGDHIAVYQQIFSATSCTYVIKQWLTDNTPESSEFLAHLLLGFLANGVNKNDTYSQDPRLQ